MNAQMFVLNSFENENHKSVDFLTQKILEMGGEVDSVSGFDENNTIVSLEQITDADLTFFVVNEADSEKLLLKKNISAYFGDELIENSYAKNFVENYCKNYKSKESLNKENWLLPRNAKCLETNNSAVQGFYFKEADNYCFFVPNNLSAIKEIWSKHLFKLIADNFKNLRENLIIKEFGLSKLKITERLKDLISNRNQIKINVFENGLDCKIVLSYSKRTPPEVFQSFIARVIDLIKGYIYSYDDEEISQTVFKILKKNKLKLAVAESITGGELTSTLVKQNVGMSDVLIEGMVSYTPESKIKRLNVSEQTLKDFSAVSPETAFEMCSGLLAQTNADFVVSTCGYSQINELSSGIAYIGIGNYKKIHIYKVECSGSREEVIQTVTKYALFHLLKNLEMQIKNN